MLITTKIIFTTNAGVLRYTHRTAHNEITAKTNKNTTRISINLIKALCAKSNFFPI